MYQRLVILLQIHDIIRRVSLDVNASSWKRILDSFGKIAEALIEKEGTSENSSRIRSMVVCFETLRYTLSCFLHIYLVQMDLFLYKVSILSILEVDRIYSNCPI